jgi:NAD(P)H dehydrogenase (quinone)
MPNSKPKILILGATGQVGQGVVEILKRNPDVEVIAAARSPEKAKRLGVPVVHLDLGNPEPIASAVQGIDRSLLATGYTIDVMRKARIS